MKLIAPIEYLAAPPRIRDRICNGTGSQGTPPWIVRILDSFHGWGIDFSPASNIHDWMYHWSHGLFFWKIYADLVFLANMILLSVYAIGQKPLSRMIGNLVMFPARILRAAIYFAAVLLFGWYPFWYGTTKRPQ